MDVDPDYDPSEFLLSGYNPMRIKEEPDPQQKELKIDDDLAISESDDEQNIDNPSNIQQQFTSQAPDDGDDDGIWF